MLIIFFIGFLFGKNYSNNRQFDKILDIDNWDVKTFSKNGKVLYESNNLKKIEEYQKDAWDELLEQISIVGFKRNKTRGSTANTLYKIEMKNGDIYYIDWLGCLEQVDITYPSGKVEKYYGYYTLNYSKFDD